MKDIELILDTVIRENKVVVNEWLADKPGSWGALSGKALIAVKSELGKNLNDSEKRLIWKLLWDKLMGIKDKTTF